MDRRTSQDNAARRGGPWGSGRPPPVQRTGIRLLILLAGFVALLIALSSLYSPGSWVPGNEIQFVKLVAIGAVMVFWLAQSRRRLSTIVGQLAVWCTVLLVVVIGYGYRAEFAAAVDRVTGNLVPGRGRTIDIDTIAFSRAADGHFWVDATVDTVAVRFLVDTGASGVVLTKQDAKRLGFIVADLAFTSTFETANGRTRGAPVTLEHLQIGPILLDRVPASVNE